MSRAQQHGKGRRVLIWLSFSVAFALGPLFVNFLLFRSSPTFTWTDLLTRGELFLVSAAICADAVGKMWMQEDHTGYFSTCCLIGAVFILFATSIEFGMVAHNLDAGGRLSPEQVHDSLLGFGGTVMAGLGAVLAEG